MIGHILAKELTEHRRDGRVRGIAALIGALILVSLATGWSAQTQQRRTVGTAQTGDQETFLKQEEKPPHSVAHFGRMAYKPVPPLGIFDPGAMPYLGQAVWLEAHRRNPAMFRAAEDSPELRRLADLSVAGILQMLLPLLVFLMGYGAFAGERERGTLRQVLSAGPGLKSLFVGKLAAVAGSGVAVVVAAICVSTALGTMTGGSAWDPIARGCALAAGYILYVVAFAAVALFISARSHTATSAILILLSLWALSVVAAPRIAASVAERAYPTPDSAVFWSQASEAIRAHRPDRKSEEHLALERQVLSRALGREVRADEAATMTINRRGLSFEVSELLGARGYAEAYRQLYAVYENQRRLRRWFSMLSPTIPLQHFSSALTGTDTAAHEHFVLEAERQRNEIIRALNEDQMLNGASSGDAYLASAELWRRIPQFAYQPPSVGSAWRSGASDLLALVAWAALAIWLAWRSAGRQRVVEAT
jgi:ABC-2 type transport system permease protein